ncbi:MAG: HEPN domain-containing protein [Candidatus Sulfotelmatobacter sp.]
MPYQSNFLHADEIIAHLGGLRGPALDPLLEAKYVGFVAVACVTVFEMAIKDILISFAAKKHKVLGTLVRSRCERMNGRIQLDSLKSDYVSPLGVKYKERFDRKVKERANAMLQANHRDIRASYKNIILWRNDFAHAAAIGNATWAEVVQAYGDGKEILDCLHQSLVR